MADEDEQAQQQYDVVINHEEQYSIWPVGKEIPNGWRAVGKSGDKASCLSHIAEVWTDMRPLSLRKQMEASGS
jgi:MbtH protein